VLFGRGGVENFEDGGEGLEFGLDGSGKDGEFFGNGFEKRFEDLDVPSDSVEGDVDVPEMGLVSDVFVGGVDKAFEVEDDGACNASLHGLLEEIRIEGDFKILVDVFVDGCDQYLDQLGLGVFFLPF